MEAQRTIISSQKNKKININYSFYFLILLFLYLGKIDELLIIILSLSFHELSHVFFAKVFKQKIGKITLTLFGFYCDINLYNLSKNKKILVIIAGVIANILLIIIGFILDNELLIHYNLLMFLISLVPIYPLDGYGITSIVIYKYRNIISIIFFFLLIILTLYVKSLGLLIFIIFLIYKQKTKREYDDIRRLKGIISSYFNNQKKKSIMI